jgi:Cu(I)/Ag(I) efflux system membrane fusion protein
MTRKTYIIGLIAFVLGGLLTYFVFQDTSHTEGTHTSESTNGESEDATIYTCSMHPSVEQDEPGDCPICGMDLIPKSSTASDDPLQLQMSAEAVKLSQLELTEVRPVGDGEGKVVRLSGLLKEDLDQSSRLISYIPGELVRLYVKSEGERVRKGQVIADVYVPELRIHQEELLDAAERREEAPDLYRASRQKLDYWKIDSAFIEKLLETKEVRDILPVYSTVSGTVRELMVTEGDMLNRGQSIARVSNLNQLWAEFEVPESELDLIRKGRVIRFSPTSAPNREYRGTIYYIDPEIDPVKRTAIARARVTARDYLKPEMVITGYISVSSQYPTEQVVVPASAVLWTGPRSVVYVKVPNADVPSYSFREVKLDRFGRDEAYISEGLEVGEEVVSQGAFVIDAAAQLNNQKSMMNRMVEAKGSKPSSRHKMNPLHQEATQEAIDVYLQLKDALVNSDAAKGKKAGAELYEQLRQIPGTIEKADRRDRWMARQSLAEEGAQKLSETEDLDVQRKAFEDLSKAFIFWLRHFKIDFDTIYLQYCPMAFDFAGADWISAQEEIRNPYFGDEMLKCGSVEEVFE